MVYLVVALAVAVSAAVVLVLVLRSQRAAATDAENLTMSDAESVPEWADFFTPAQWRRFLAEVDRYFRARRRPYRMEDGVVYVSGDEEEQQRGLGNLAQYCHATTPDQWAEVIARHFDGIEAGRAEIDAVEQDLYDFGLVRAKLHVRLAGEDALPLEMLVHRQDLPGTVSYLVLDLPTTIRTVSPEEAQMWARTTENLFDIALDNVEAAAMPDWSEQSLEGGLPLQALLGDSFFVASLALRLENYPQCLGRGGALVAIPHRHCLLSHPINHVAAVQAVHQLALITQGMYKEGPGSISPSVYWYFAGQFHEIPVQISESQVLVRPPPAFLDMLNDLAGEQDEDNN
jgi:hypothetical protein